MIILTIPGHSINFLSLSIVVMIKATTIHFPTVIKKALGMNVAHAMNLPSMRSHLMRMIDWQERLFKVLTSITMISY